MLNVYLIHCTICSLFVKSHLSPSCQQSAQSLDEKVVREPCHMSSSPQRPHRVEGMQPSSPHPLPLHPFDFWTPPYFCDMCYFHRVDMHHIIIKNTLKKKIKGFIYILSSSFPALFGSTFENFQKNHFLLHFGTFLKIKDFPRIFVSGNSIRQKWT